MSTTGFAFAGSPRLTSIYPSCGPRGGEIEIACGGNNLADARELLFDTPGFKVVELKAPDDKERRLRANVAIAAESVSASIPSGCDELGDQRCRLFLRFALSAR